jgi:methionyl-tRNA formyltransferase
MTIPRVVLLTSTSLRHQYVANIVAENLDLVGVWQEEKSFKPYDYANTADDRAVIERHFAARDASEELLFADHRRLELQPGARLHVTSSGGINDPDEIHDMSALSPEVLLVFGTGLLRGGIIGEFRGRIINLHLGLSPYYRGSGTNFWPLVNREPEYVGATIHYLDAGIDTGPLIAHVRPAMQASYGPHEIGNAAIVAGAATLVHAAKAHVAGALQPTVQPGGGRLYQRKDFSADSVRRLWANFEDGMIAHYLADKRARDARLQLLPLPELV